MERVERFYRIELLLKNRRVVSIETFLDELEVSKATFKRDLDYMRCRMNVPIIWDREAGGYRLDSENAEGPVHELPGLWFSASELYALLAAHHLFTDLDNGLLCTHLGPLVEKITSLIDLSGEKKEVLNKRIRLLPIGGRKVGPAFFGDLASAVLNRKRLEITAWNRARDEVNERVVSPQRLVHYRDNWYLDAWCHLRDGLRSFSAETIKVARILEESAIDIPEADLDAHYASAYGIFAGKPKGWAVLKFSPERARWVKDEQWHPLQVGESLSDGGYRLKVPYSDEREILMDILKHGSQVAVEGPETLREMLVSEFSLAARHYEGNLNR